MPSSILPEYTVRLKERVEEAIQARFTHDEPDLLYDPVRYVLNGGGKRLRPVLLLLVAEAFGRDTDEALPAALAVELFHNFTLIHDDMMDGDQERRGRPTVHVAWDDGTAILTGDLIFGLSYELLAELPRDVDLRAVHDVYDPMVRELCRGQALDTAFENRDDVSVDAYVDMIRGKTVALLAATFHLGALVGGASPEARTAMHRAGENVGLAFQIQDDLLDFTADDKDWGRNLGGDLRRGKKTYVTLRMLERANGETRASFLASMQRGDDLTEAEFRDVCAMMEDAGVFEDAREAVKRHTRNAMDALDALPDSPAASAIHDTITWMQARSH